MCGTLENWTLLLSLSTTVIGSVLAQRQVPSKIEIKYILFQKPVFHRLIYSRYEIKTVSMWGKCIAAEQ